ncbi:MAG: hypothetical protein FJ280_00810 [Planctomycetes bacterium]|nr:hypothetical protein [Planctomycetota bacterium]
MIVHRPGARKAQAPNSKSQTNPKSKIPMTKTLSPHGGAVWDFGFSSVLDLFDACDRSLDQADRSAIPARKRGSKCDSGTFVVGVLFGIWNLGFGASAPGAVARLVFRVAGVSPARVEGILPSIRRRDAFDTRGQDARDTMSVATAIVRLGVQHG